MPEWWDGKIPPDNDTSEEKWGCLPQLAVFVLSVLTVWL